MSVRQVVCPRGCGDAAVWATAPNGGRMLLQPYPDPDGKHMVVVRRDGRLIVTDWAAPSETVKRYDPHSGANCVTGKNAAPRTGRPTQLTIGDT